MPRFAMNIDSAKSAVMHKVGPAIFSQGVGKSDFQVTDLYGYLFLESCVIGDLVDLT
jgi:hypothetical protein